jgi:pyrroline-5-carboxylate reductase
MGIAILSGVIASIESSTFVPQFPKLKWESHTPGTSTPIDIESDPSLPGRFIACVNRRETAEKLKQTFQGLRRPVEVVAGENLRAVQEADVVILWYVFVMGFYERRMPLFIMYFQL